MHGSGFPVRWIPPLRFQRVLPDYTPAAHTSARPPAPPSSACPHSRPITDLLFPQLKLDHVLVRGQDKDGREQLCVGFHLGKGKEGRGRRRMNWRWCGLQIPNSKASCPSLILLAPRGPNSGMGGSTAALRLRMDCTTSDPARPASSTSSGEAAIWDFADS